MTHRLLTHEPDLRELEYGILLARIQDGDATTKVLVLKALAEHTGGHLSRQFADTITRAKADPDEKVAATARKLFDWVKDDQAR